MNYLALETTSVWECPKLTSCLLGCLGGLHVWVACRPSSTATGAWRKAGFLRWRPSGVEACFLGAHQTTAPMDLVDYRELGY